MCLFVDLCVPCGEGRDVVDFPPDSYSYISTKPLRCFMFSFVCPFPVRFNVVCFSFVFAWFDDLCFYPDVAFAGDLALKIK